jgi:uncharacterized protein
MGVLLASLWALACNGNGGEPSVSHAEAPTYRPGLPLHAEVVDGGLDGSVRLERITYTSADGQRVPALFATPAAGRPRGCLVYQGGFGQTKEQSRDLRESAAALRLATFAIDARETGDRGGVEQALAAVKEPETLLAMVLGTVVDLRMGVDYLQGRPECHGTIAFAGTSFGAGVGVLFAAQERRIKAVVLTSLGATFKQQLLVLSVTARHVPNLPVVVPGAAADPTLLKHAVSVLGPYDAVKWIGKIAPRPLLLVNGRFDPIVPPIDALEVAAAARDPKTVVYFNGGHDPFAPGPDQQAVAERVTQFLAVNLGLRSGS